MPASAPSSAAQPPKAGAAAALSAPQKALLKLGLRRPIDLALHLPLRYEDETRITRLADAVEGEMVQIEATVTACAVQFRGRRQLVVTVDDGSDTCTLRFLHFYPNQQKAMAEGTRLRIRGELRGGFAGWSMVHPTCRPATGDLPTALTPVYPTSAGLPQAYLRKAVHAGLARADLSETVPRTLLPASMAELSNGNAASGMWGLHQALSFLHHPTADVSLHTLEDRSHPAWQRLKAEELLAQQLSQHQARDERAALRAPALCPALPAGAPGATAGVATQAGSGAHAVQPVPAVSLGTALLGVLPFALTGAQQRVGEEIATDLARHVPMHRLLQGDVGSGKTVVAALAAARCIEAGWQCALMVPTEILATQHFAKLVAWLDPLLAARGQRVAWLTGNVKGRARREMLDAIADGSAALVVGTHAVIQDKVVFKALALAIIDEQHRFGVAQRLALREKMAAPGQEPHLLMMSATPIPRTLAMSYYADLDVSTLDELPPGRTPVVTKLIAEHRRDDVVERIRSQIGQGRQAYWVCPLIEESEALDLVNATATHEMLCDALPGVLVGLLHSRMPAAEKAAVMSLFTQGQMGVLVSTTVIEVGVDVPNASLMVIEHAERFGLSQLHQLRGRVGRGPAASACILLYGSGEGGRLSDSAKARLKAMADTTDGFEIARRDLDIRGPGEFLGARQSGAPLLRFADLATDTELLEWARRVAPVLLHQHPELAARHVERWLGSKAEFLKA